MRVKESGPGIVVLVVLGAFVAAATQGLGAVGGEERPAAGANISGLDQVVADRMAAAAQADQETAQLIGPRTSVVQVLDPQDGKSPVVVRFIDYASMTRFSVFVDRKTERVVGRSTDDDWPDYSPGETSAAARIALSDAGLLALRRDWVVNNITGAIGVDECLERRCIVVMLTPPDGDYAFLRLAIVDLGLERVVAVETGQ